MNLTALEADLQPRLGFNPSSIQTADSARLRRFLNETHRELLGKGSIGQKCRRATLPFLVVSGSPYAVLPHSAVSLSGIGDRTNFYPLDSYSLFDIRFADPGLSSSGTAPYGFVELLLAAATALVVTPGVTMFAEGSAADVRTVYMEGVKQNGHYFTSSAVLTGTTPVQLGPTLSVGFITKFYVSTVSLTSDAIIRTNASSDEVAKIVAGRTYARYTRLQIYPTPSSAFTLYADVELHVEDMAIGSDEPLISEDFHWLLISGALKKEYMRKREFDMHDREAARYNQGERDLISFLNRPKGPVHNPRRPARFSQLGPMFPAGS